MYKRKNNEKKKRKTMHSMFTMVQGGKSARHFRESCKGKRKKQVRTGKSEKCKETISKSNIGRHKEICGSKHIMRRKYPYQKRKD